MATLLDPECVAENVRHAGRLQFRRIAQFVERSPGNAVSENRGAIFVGSDLACLAYADANSI